MEKFLKAQLIGIRPEAVYRDIVYEQTVEIELRSGIQMGLFDSLPKVTPELIGKSKNLVILAVISEIEKISETTPRIKPLFENPLYWKNHSFYGRIEKIGVEDKWNKGVKYEGLVLLDVGEGSILANFNKETLKTIEEGDYVKVSAHRADLLHIN